MKGFNDRCLDVNVDLLYVKLRGGDPANTRRRSSAGVIRGQRRSQWASISQTLDQRVVFTRDRINVVKELWTRFSACVFLRF